MNTLHRSFLISAVERYGNLFVALVSTAVLSRLLTPAEFGMFAIVSALTSVITVSFQEFGGANYLIQKATLTDQDVRTAFTITLCTSIVIAVAFVAFSGPLARFFSKEELQLGLAVNAINVLLVPFSVTISALLRREMAFGTVSICSLAGNTITALTSIVLAAIGFKFMSPIWGALAGGTIGVALLVGFWRNVTIFKPSFAGYREVLSFGGYSFGAVIINVLYNFMPQLVLGRVLDFTAVGLYNRALTVTQTFDRVVVQALNPVIMPAVSAQSRAGANLKTIYLHSIELITVVQWPCLIVIALTADSLVRVWLGAQWMETVPLIRILSIASLSLFMAPLSYPMLVALGRVRDALTSSLIALLPSLCVVIAATFYGIWAVAASALLTLPFQAAVALFYVCRPLAIGPAELARAMTKSGVVALCCAAGVAASIAIGRISEPGPVIELLLAGAFAGVAWWSGLALTKHPLLDHLLSAASGMVRVAPRLSFLWSR